jgi:hypothetical protein
MMSITQCDTKSLPSMCRDKSVSSFVDFCNLFTCCAEVGTEGKLGGQAHVAGVAGVWKDLTDNVRVSLYHFLLLIELR